MLAALVRTRNKDQGGWGSVSDRCQQSWFVAFQVGQLQCDALSAVTGLSYRSAFAKNAYRSVPMADTPRSLQPRHTQPSQASLAGLTTSQIRR